MKIGFTGARRGMTPAQRDRVRELLRSYGHLREFHHGDCVGADAEAHDIAASLELATVAHPSNDPRQRAGRLATRVAAPLPPLDRNRVIVSETDELIACPDGPERARSGTWYTVRRARETGRHITIVMPDGTMRVENTTHALELEEREKGWRDD